MKKLLLMALLVWGVNAQAQYFQHLYGTNQWDFTTHGVNTNVQGAGYFIVGARVTDQFAIPSIVASFTDVNGDVPGGPYFNNEFELVDVNGDILYPATTRVFEMDNGNGFGIVGLAYSPTGTGTRGIFYMQLDPSGNPFGLTLYYPGNASFSAGGLGGIAESVISGGDDLYVTGMIGFSGGTHIFVMKIDVNSGGIVWSNVYDILASATPTRKFANAIIESPYQPAGVDEVAVVGEVHVSGNSDAFFLRLDANTGAPLSSVQIYGTTTTNDAFNSINIAASTAGGSDGYIMAGRTGPNTNPEFWLHKSDQVGNTLWSNSYAYNGPTTTSGDVLNHVIERLNTSGNYEYYSVGTAGDGVFGGPDAVVLKTDDNGNPFALGQFSYGMASYDYGLALDQYNGTGADGLSIFASHENVGSGLGRHDMYLIRAYFNGYSGCNEDFRDFSPVSGPGLYNKYKIKIPDRLTTSTLSYNQYSYSDLTLCYGLVYADGDNSFVAPAKTGDDAMVVSPNPMQAGTAIVNVGFESAASEDVSVAIYDMLGREYYNNKFTINAGQNQLPLDISNANMAAGTYSVRITGATNSRNMLLMVK